MRIRHYSPARFMLSGFRVDTSSVPLDDLTEVVIGCAMAVHDALGPGLLESIYTECMMIELAKRGIPAEVEKRISITYAGKRVRGKLIIDLLVDARLVVEMKAVERLHPVHLAQVITYLKITDCPAGLLLNFNATSIRAGLRRLDRPDLYAAKRAARTTRSND